MNLCLILMAWENLSTRKFNHKKKEMFGRNHNKGYQNLLIWTMSWIKKMLKSMLTPIISLLGLRYAYLTNKGEK